MFKKNCFVRVKLAATGISSSTAGSTKTTKSNKERIRKNIYRRGKINLECLKKPPGFSKICIRVYCYICRVTPYDT